MEITQKHIDIFKAKVCPYCGSGTKTISETDVYGREYNGRAIISCVNYPECDSYVGTHDDGQPLGRLANKSLRLAKKQAHEHFDRLWKDGFIKRNHAYKLMSLYLNIPPEFTHIGMFKKETCLEVVEWSKDLYQQQIKRTA